MEFYLPGVAIVFTMPERGESTNMRGKNGGGAGTRTPDTGIMIPLLYQLSYTAPKKFRG